MNLQRFIRRKCFWLVLLGGSLIFTFVIAWFVHQPVAREHAFNVDLKTNFSKIDLQNRLLLGVHPNIASKYLTKNSTNIFMCLDESKSIKITEVNDNYCDCVNDASDEPGTSACNNGRFYCKEEKHFIPSYYVNDGICDCCDGADEWRNLHPSGFILPSHSNKPFAPCKSYCNNQNIKTK